MTSPAVTTEPAWIAALRAACEQSSQAKVGRRLGLSASTINQVLKGTYPSGLDRIRGLVEGELLGATVVCPVLGEIPRNRCLEHQRRPFAATSPMRVQLYHACPVCPQRQEVRS